MTTTCTVTKVFAKPVHNIRIVTKEGYFPSGKLTYTPREFSGELIGTRHHVRGCLTKAEVIARLENAARWQNIGVGEIIDETGID